MTTTTALLTNTAYGFPRGQKRRVAPIALMCIHITGNSRLASAIDERNYANRSLSVGPSAHDYVDRNGDVVHAIDTVYAAWSNGDVSAPLTAVRGVAAVVAFRDRYLNVNEAYVREVECVGFPGTFPVTDAQLESAAQLIARDSIASGLPISAATVHTHAYINSIDRSNCAFSPAERAANIAGLIGRSQAIKDQLIGTGEEMGLSVRLLATSLPAPIGAFGTAKITGTGHSIIRVADRTPQAVPDGYDLGVVQRGSLVTPFDHNPGDRTSVVVFNNLGESWFALLMDVAFTLLPTPVPDCTAAVSAATTQLIATNDAQAAQIQTLESRVVKSKDLAKQIELV